MNTVPRTLAALTEGILSSASSPPARWFEFLVLPENEAATRAVRLIAKAIRTGKRPIANPLMLHGPPGTGKSQLVAALVKQISQNPQGRSVQVVSVNDLARATDEGFADPDLLDADLLVLEDVQHLNVQSANAVGDLIDRRVTRQRATIVTAGVGPAALGHLPRRLTSRLVAGLVVSLNALSIASRRAILTDAAATRKVRLTPEAIDWLAQQTTGGGVRTTLGLLQNLAPLAKTSPGPLARIDVEQALAETGQLTSPTLDVSAIIKRVAAAFGISTKELLGPSRLRGVLYPRHLAMYLARELTGLSLPRIGAAFGGRDHTTVLHACRKIEEALKEDAALARQVRDLRATLV